MKIKIDKDCILWQLNSGFQILYLWWGIEPWTNMHEVKCRVIEFGIGWRHWEFFKFKV